MSSTIRRAGVSLVAGATLVLSTVGGAAAQPITTTDDPAEAAAGWLTTQLTADGDGLYYDAGFEDVGLTLDILFGLAGAGVAADTMDAIGNYLDRAGTVAAYTGPAWDDVWAGQTAKLIIGADVVGLDATSVGGSDLVEQLEALQSDEDGELGWYRNATREFDFSSTLSQSLAVVALHRVGATATLDAGVDFLLDQQCEDGGFRAIPNAETCNAQVDTTAVAADALYTVGKSAEADLAVAWLAAQQEPNGAFQGSDDLSTNSTGLAAVAFSLAGPGYAAELTTAREWILGLQNGCETDAPGAIHAGPADEGDLARATPQALSGLVGASIGTVTAAGATTSVGLLDCAEEQPPRDLTVTCDVDGEVLPGDRVACHVAGLDADEVVHVLVTLNPTLLDEDVTADDDGVAAFAFDVPDDANEGDSITIVINGEGDSVGLSLTIGAPDGSGATPVDETVVETGVEVDGDTDEPLEGTQARAGELPRTGAPAPLLAALAVALVAIGALLLALNRGRDERA